MAMQMETSSSPHHFLVLTIAFFISLLLDPSMQNTLETGQLSGSSIDNRTLQRAGRSRRHIAWGHYIGDACVNISDCKFQGAICAQTDGECHCKVGQRLVEGSCVSANCTTDQDCPFSRFYSQQTCKSGVCACAAPATLDTTDGVFCENNELPDWAFFLSAILVIIFIILPICGFTACAYQALTAHGSTSTKDESSHIVF